MMIMSACCRLRDSKNVPLLLQQYQYKGVRVLFACVCIGEGRDADKAGEYMAQQLLVWFRGLDPEKLAGNPAKAMGRMSDGLAGTIRRLDGELENGRVAAEVGFAGIICLENSYLMFHRGAQRIYMINKAFNRVYVQRLYRHEAEGDCMEQGILQPDVGLLLASESFYRHVSDTMIKEALCIGEMMSEGQMGRHLKELVEEGGRRGSNGIGAVYLRTMPENIKNVEGMGAVLFEETHEEGWNGA